MVDHMLQYEIFGCLVRNRGHSFNFYPLGEIIHHHKQEAALRHNSRIGPRMSTRHCANGHEERIAASFVDGPTSWRSNTWHDGQFRTKVHTSSVMVDQ